MRRLSWQSKTVILIFLFIVLIFGGRYIFSNKSEYKNSSGTSPIEISDSTAPEESGEPESASDTPSLVSTDKKDTSVSGCIAEMKAKVAKDKTEYEKGSILVGFNAGISLADAEKVLATYGVVIRDKQYAKENMIPDVF